MRYPIFSFLLLLLVFVAISPAQAVEYGESAQQFLIGQSQASAKPGRVQRRTETPLIRSGFSFGRSWLEANLGASRPAGAPGPWCGYAMRLEVVAMGRTDPGPAYNAVRSWHSYGTPAPRGAIGSLFISAGHISKVVAHDCGDGRVRTISGNATARRVAYMCEPLSSLVVSRWP